MHFIMFNLIKLYMLNMYNILHLNHTSRKWFKNKNNIATKTKNFFHKKWAIFVYWNLENFTEMNLSI